MFNLGDLVKQRGITNDVENHKADFPFTYFSFIIHAKFIMKTELIQEKGTAIT